MEENDIKYVCQECQDDVLVKEFREFHVKIVNEIILFCKEHNLKIDEFNLGADGVRSSIEFGEWVPATDSSFSFSVDGEDKDFLLSI